MSLLEWINGNGLIFAIMLFLGAVFLIGINAIARELHDRYFWRFQLKRKAELSVVDPHIGELIEYFDHIKDSFDHLSGEMEDALEEINKRATTETKPIEFGKKIIKLREK